MRGRLELGNHKLAGLFRAPAERNRWKHARREKCPDETYRQTWRLVAGAVRDTFANHPEYLTPAGRNAAERSITKRVTGTLHGYAAQVARGRSAGLVEAPADAAAGGPNVCTTGQGQTGCSVRGNLLARVLARAWGASAQAAPKFNGDKHE